MPQYRCRDQDHISKIAIENNRVNSDSIWLDSSNDQLRALRGDPNCLFKDPHGPVGSDTISIPAAAPPDKKGGVDKNNPFVLPTKDLWIRVRILKENFEAIPNAKFALTIPGSGLPNDTVEGTTDAKGEISQRIPNYFTRRDVSYGRTATLTVRVPAPATDNPQPAPGAAPPAAPQPVRGPVPVTWELKIGKLNPIKEQAPDRNCISGVQARLNNLCLNCGPVDGITGPNTKSSIKAFRQIFNIPSDAGKEDVPDIENFQPKLYDVHDKPQSVLGPAPPPPATA